MAAQWRGEGELVAESGCKRGKGLSPRDVGGGKFWAGSSRVPCWVQLLLKGPHPSQHSGQRAAPEEC